MSKHDSSQEEEQKKDNEMGLSKADIDIDSEIPLSQLPDTITNTSNDDALTQSNKKSLELFMNSEEAKLAQENEKFGELFLQFLQAADIEEENEEEPEDLPPEDDEGNIEYKYKMQGLNFAKINRRLTQMSYRIIVSHHTTSDHY